MKKIVIAIFFILIMIINFQIPCSAEDIYKSQESKELLYQDILMTILGPDINTAVNDYYLKLFTEKVSVYPYQIDVIRAERMGGFRTFHFLLVLEVTPVVGPHVEVGKDRLTFEITPGITPKQAKLIKFEHMETYELPPHWKHIIRKP